jgi:Fe-S-cluster containining protein
MPFTCRQCGTCCMHMGDYLAIERQIDSYAYACSSVSTGTPFLAVIDADKRSLFEDRTWNDHNPSACSFQCPRGDQFVCTIHETSPPQCKAYQCVVLHIHSSEGKSIRIVSGTLALHTDDRTLRQIWDTGERVMDRSRDGAEERITQFLKTKGYQVW